MAIPDTSPAAWVVSLKPVAVTSTVVPELLETALVAPMEVPPDMVTSVSPSILRIMV